MNTFHLKLREVIRDPQFQKGLCRLYRYSASECVTGNGKVTPDVGRMRERDLIRTLHWKGVDTRQFSCKDSRADCFIDSVNNPLSIKHYASKRDGGFKVTWTSDKTKADEEIRKFVRNGLHDNMLIVKLDESRHTVTFRFMSVDTLNKLIRKCAEYKEFDPLNLFSTDPYKVFKKKEDGTNDRGVEFTSKFLKEFYKNCDWSESFEGDFTGDPKDADERRDEMLLKF